jgi:hypothetical protein
VYKLDPSIELLGQWSNPLDTATARSFEPANKYNNLQRKQPFGAPQQPTIQQSFIIDKRDVNMPNKVKREVLREVSETKLNSTWLDCWIRNACSYCSLYSLCLFVGVTVGCSVGVRIYASR